MTKGQANKLYNILYEFMQELNKEYNCGETKCETCEVCALCSLNNTSLNILEEIECK